MKFFNKIKTKEDIIKDINKLPLKFNGSLEDCLKFMKDNPKLEPLIMIKASNTKTF